MAKFKNEILVRDKRIEQMQAQGIKLQYRVLSGDEYKKSLRLKLVEEAQEAASEERVEGLKKELADVLEVVLALADEHGVSIAEIEDIRKMKREKTGSFDGRYYIEHVEIDEDNPEIKYFLDRPQKYPKI